MSLPLSLLHGWGTTPAVWTALRGELDSSRACIAPCLPGHAPGEAPGERLEAWVDQLLPALPARSHLCGWSLGGLLALAIALRAPERVGRVVLFAASARFVAAPDWPGGLPEADVVGFEQRFATAPEALVKRFHALQSIGDARRRQVQDALRDSALAPSANPAGLADGLALLRRSDLREQLAAVAAPVRILHGAGDALMPAAGAVKLSERLPDARLTLFDDCGHAPMLSRPRDCATLIAGFLDE